ncbi:hypothetical protein OCH239_13070 [Roseivivax halodurans JCM 10272]|uniref:Prokaryotic STING domain-containing protein n=1 Tax=Roseivivax halodurans JCM 10272 TaxID=1449350 RepID=X7EAP3_9RHOB|nr:STING domain-containing protein [Roseivivax halodurans]ETX13159.1 hypothetical protein OCH239_13070 [Roseivivax halodurans JCM 10272]
MESTREPLDIFIGGPMGNPRTDGAGLSFDDHLPNIAAVIQRIITEYQEQNPDGPYRPLLLDPSREAIGTITDRVFSMIERSELGIFDCSSASPSAMYELTLMHALGKPVIPVAFRNPKVPEARTISHYLRDEYALLVDTFTEEELYNGLSQKIGLMLSGQDTTLNASSNAISKFYGLPLLDVSATTGLATGYFHNFLRHQLQSRAKVFVDITELEAIVIIVPHNLAEVGGLKDVLEQRAKANGFAYEEVRREDGGNFVVSSHVRGRVLLDKIGPYLVDIPAPLMAQMSSPRRDKLLRDQNAAHPRMQQEFVLRLERLERAMIDRWFYTVRNLVTRDVLRSDRLLFLSVDELFSKLEEWRNK